MQYEEEARLTSISIIFANLQGRYSRGVGEPMSDKSKIEWTDAACDSSATAQQEVLTSNVE
jgi:hypothetical protein